MKVSTAGDGITARKIITACAVNKTVLAAVSDKWPKEGLLDTRHGNVIVGWCVDYFRKYHRAPKRELESIFDQWSNRTQDKELVKGVESLMVGLSKEYQAGKVKVQEDHTIDLAGRLFKKVLIRRKLKEAEAKLDTDDIDAASGILESYAPMQMGSRSWVKGTVPDEKLRQALRKAQQPPLVTLPGAAGQFFGNIFRRQAFVVYEGPEKRGKTTHLTDIGYRAIKKNLKTAFFAVGDMSLDEMLEMFARRVTGRPLWGEPTKFKYPIAMQSHGESVEVSTEERERPNLTYGAARKAWKKFNAKHGTDLLRIAAYPNDSISILGLLAELRSWERHGWVPDVVIIDYLDLLAPCVSGKIESREQIDKTWKQARAMAQVFDCCVVSASQTDADSYSAEVISMKNFSGSKTKNAHVTAMIGLNQNDQQKEQGVMGYNLVVRRRGKSVASKVCYAAGCPDIGNPVILSSY